jgi:hypothetical protein
MVLGIPSLMDSLGSGFPGSVALPLPLPGFTKNIVRNIVRHIGGRPSFEDEDILRVELTHDKYMIVDNNPKVRELLAAYKWYCFKTARGDEYAAATIRDTNGRRFPKYFHRLIMMPEQPGKFVVHLDRDNYNNRISNLQWVSHFVNPRKQPNRRKHKKKEEEEEEEAVVAAADDDDDTSMLTTTIAVKATAVAKREKSSSQSSSDSESFEDFAVALKDLISNPLPAHYVCLQRLDP